MAEGGVTKTRAEALNVAKIPVSPFKVLPVSLSRLSPLDLQSELQILNPVKRAFLTE